MSLPLLCFVELQHQMQVISSIVVCLHGSTPKLDLPYNQPCHNIVQKGLPAPCVRKLLICQEHTLTSKAEARRHSSLYVHWQQYSRSRALVFVCGAFTSVTLTSTKSILPRIACCVQSRLVLCFAALIGVRFERHFFVGCLNLCVCRLPRKTQHHTVYPSERFQKRHQHSLGSLNATDHLNSKCHRRSVSL